MPSVKHLLQRLDDIAEALRAHPSGVALLGLGSVGRERDRLDEYSDLDFFAIVQPGTKAQFLDNRSWLETTCRLTYYFRNTRDGFKLWWDDGIYGEMAVFEPDELCHIPYSPGQLVWCREGYCIPEISAIPLPPPPKVDIHYELNELLTNLLVGLLRDARGERLAAHYLIQTIAFGRLLKMLSADFPSQHPEQDPFSIERRFERNYPEIAVHLPTLLAGYTHNREAAAMLLHVVEHYWSVPPVIANVIRERTKAQQAM